jgi:hypothetical protein
MLAALAASPLVLSALVAGRLAIVASSSTAEGQPQLRYAGRDADRVAAVLRELGGFDDVWSLHEPSPTELRTALARAERVAAADPKLELIVYYSGHADGRGLLLGREPFPYEELRQALVGSHAAVRVAVLDACHAGGAVTPKGGQPSAGFPIPTMPVAQVKGAAILAASTASELAQESSELEGSYFTHHMLSALRGAGDRDDNGFVTLGEAYEYAYGRTVAATLPSQWGPQHPSFDYKLTGTGELVLTNLHRTGRALWLPAGAPATYYVATTRNEIVAEVTSQPGRRARLILPAGRYRVIRRQDRRAYAAEVDLRVADAAIGDERFAAVNPELALAKGHDVSRRNELYVDIALSGLGPGTLNGNGEVGVGWFRRGVHWSFGPHVGYGRATGSVYGADYRLARVTAMAYGLRRVRLPFSELQLGGGAGAAFVHQSLADGTHDGVGPAAQAGLALEVPLAEAIALRLWWGGGVELLKLDGDYSVIPEARAALSLSWLY